MFGRGDARTHEAKIVYIGSTDGPLCERLRSHLRLIHEYDRGKAAQYREWAEGKHITIFAHHPCTVKSWAARFPCTALLRQPSSKNSVGLESRDGSSLGANQTDRSARDHALQVGAPGRATVSGQGQNVVPQPFSGIPSRGELFRGHHEWLALIDDVYCKHFEWLVAAYLEARVWKSRTLITAAPVGNGRSLPSGSSRVAPSST